MRHTEKPVVVEQKFNVSTAQLWTTITEFRQMRQWFFENIDAFEPVVGFETRFVVENEGRIFPHLWKITEVSPGKRIIYNWQYEGYEGNSFVAFEISELNNGAKLTLTHKTTTSFPQDIPEFRRENCQQGWEWFINKRLTDFLKLKYSKTSNRFRKDHK